MHNKWFFSSGIITINQIYELHYDDLIVFVRKIIGRTLDADIIVVNAFTELWLHHDSIVSVDQIRPYLFVTARNSCIKFLIRQQLFISLDVVSTTSRPEILNTIDSKKAYAWLNEAINKLPAKQKQVAELLLQHLSDEEIAEKLRTSVANVKTLRTRIKQNLLKFKDGWDFDYLVSIIVLLLVYKF